MKNPFKKIYPRYFGDSFNISQGNVFFQAFGNTLAIITFGQFVSGSKVVRAHLLGYDILDGHITSLHTCRFSGFSFSQYKSSDFFEKKCHVIFQQL